MGVGRAVALAGLGRGIQQAGQTIGRVSREARERKRQEEQDRRANEGFELTRASALANIAQDGGFVGDLDPRYYNPDGTPKPANGQGSIGAQVGASTASTQAPYETERVPMRSVGQYGGKQIWMPADGMRPSERTSAARERRTAQAQEQEFNDLLAALAEHPRTRDLPEAVRRGLARDPVAARGAIEDIEGKAAARERGQRRGAQDAPMTPAERAAIQRIDLDRQRLSQTEGRERRTALNTELSNAQSAYTGARTEAGSVFSRQPKPNNYPGYEFGRFSSPSDSAAFAGDMRNWQRDTASANQRVRQTRGTADSLSGVFSREFGGQGGAAPAATPAATPAPARPLPGQNQAAAQAEINALAEDARAAIAEGEDEAEVQRIYQAAVQKVLQKYGVRRRQ